VLQVRLRRAAPLLVLGAFAVNAALMLWLDEVHAPQRKAEEQAWCGARPPPNYVCLAGFDPVPRALHRAIEAGVLLTGVALAAWGAWLDRTGRKPWAGGATVLLGGLAFLASLGPPGLCVNDDCLVDTVGWAVSLLGSGLVVLSGLAFFLHAPTGPGRAAR
jgi:hypothetical protein